MPNDLTAKRNLFDWRPESRQNLASSGFTATIWTLSGVVLVACGNLEEFLGLDDDGGGGNTLHVRSSAVQGARLYFDTDGVGGVTQIEKDAQDALYPEGFITDAAGQAHGIPAEFYGKPFIADLTGAINTETGESLSGAYASIANARGLHLLASPITQYITGQTGQTPEEVVAELLGLDPATLTDAQEQMRDTQLQAILNPANYLGGDEGVEALSYHITTLTNPTPSAVESQAVQLLTTDPTDPNRDTLIIVDARDMTKTIGTDSTYIATIHAVSHGDSPVEYSMVDANGAPVSGGDFNVDSRTGVVSVADGVTLTASNTAISVYVLVSNGDSEQTVKIDVTVEPVVTLSHATSAGSVAENEAGAIAVEGIETSDNVIATDFTISDALGVASGAGYAGMFEIVAVTGATNTWNLKLTDTAELDFEAIPNGVINLRVHVEPTGNAPSNILEIAVTVTDDPSDIAFSGVVRGEVTKDSDDYEVSGTITIANQPQNEAVSVSSQGTYGTLAFDSGTWTYTLDNDDPIVQNLLAEQLLIDTAELTVDGVTQNISIIINGANEDVRFEDGNGARVSDANVPTDIEIGDTAIDGSFALGNIFMDLGITLMGRLDDAETTTVEFADSVSADLRGLFSLDASGILEFTGTNAQAIGLGTRPINLNLLVSAPLSTTEQIPLNLQVNIINAVDDGMADYVVTENRDTMELTVALVDADPASATYSGDPDGVVGGVRFQWFTTTDGGETKTAIANANSATLDISASAQLPAGTTYGVTITYTDNHDIANGDTTEFDVLATPVRFTPITDPTTLMARENDANWQLQLEATSDAGGDTSPIARYEFVGTAPSGFMLNEDTGRITLTGDGLDYEAGSTHTLTIRATDSRTPAENGETRITITVQNAQEGPAEYEISRAEADNGGVIMTTLTVALIDADPTSATYSGDPDGVVGAVMFRWFTTDGTNKTYLGEASTSNTLDISANPNLSYGVEVSYTDGQGMDEEFDVFASSVRFTTPPPASIDVSEAASADYATLGVLGRFAATSSAEPPQTVTYTFEALDDAGMPVAGATGLFSISNGAISLLSNVDFETTPQYTLIITASARKEANSMEMDTAVARVTINVVNDQDGDAEYEVTENDAGTILTVELVAGDFDINTPDGAPTNPQYRWFTTADGGMNKDYITNADSDSFTIADHPLEAGEIYGVTVSYQDPLYDASDPSTLTEIDVLASPIDFTDGTDSVSSYTGTINEDGTLLADNAGDDIPLPQVMASVEDAPAAGEIKYGFLVDAGTGMTITSRLGFKIDEDDGTITVSSTIPGTDFNYDLDPPRESITLTVRATYDSNGATAGGEVHTRDVDVVITVNDLNDETPEFAPLQIVENSGAVAGIPTLAGITGTTAAEHITGTTGDDATITSGGGNDHIFGDAGDDTITLSEAVGSVETIYYRFASGTPGAWTATDGTDTIINFRRGEDRIVLIDSDDGSVIDLDTFINHNNLAMRVLWEDDEYVSGVEIMFGTTKVLEIQYHSSSHEQAFDFETNNWILGPAERYLGEILNDDVATNDPTGYISNTQEVGTTSLLPNYFNVKAGDDNLQIIATADLPTLGVDVFISESRTSADGAFATISATDADVAVIDLSYRIAGGSGASIFELHPTDNTLSVVSGMTLNYETATEYTLDLEVTDGTNSAMQTITIGITDINDSDPTATTGGIDTFAERAAVASDTETDFFITISDDDTDAVNEHNVMVVGAHASRFKFVEDGTTANQWNLVLIEGQEVDREDSSYVLSGVLTVEYEITDGTRFTSQTNSVGLRIDDINDNGPTVTASQTDAGTPITINERIDGSKTPLDVMGLTIEIADADVTAGHKSGVLGIEPIFVVRNADDLSPNSLFQVENVNGKWVLQFTDPILEGESDPSIALIIEVSDGTNLFDRTDTFTVNVINLDEGPGVYRVDGDVTMGVGQALTVTQVTEDPDGVNGDVTYQWYKEANDVDRTRTMLTADDGTPLQYTLKSGDDPTTELFGVVVIYNDNAGVEYTATNRLVDVQANYAPEITGFTDADGMEHTTAPTISISTNMNRVQEVLASITATDRNTVDTLTYAFVVNGKPTLYTSGGLETFEVTINNEVVEAIDEGGFNIDPTTGRITFSGTLHQDAHDDDKLPLTLTVQVSDGTETATADIKVDFLENTGTTTFAITYSRGEADNFYVGSQLGIGSDVLDPDTVVTQFEYDYFRLVESTDPITGETIITEEDALNQDPGQAKAYVFTAEDVGHKILVRASYTDGKSNKEVFEHTTAIVVPEPAEASSARLIITEAIADDAVITYATTDGTMNTDTDLSYEITGIKDASDADVTSAGAFEIRSDDTTAGTIYRKQGDANRLDHETNDSYTLTVTVTDSSNAPSWITSGAYAATFASDTTATTLADAVRSFAVDASTNTWTYTINALTQGNTFTETFTITLTPTDTDITAKTETLKVELGHDANGYYYILDDGTQVSLGTTLTFTTFSGTFKTLADELTTTTHDIVIEVGDINESPTETTSFAPGTTKASVHRATTTSNTEDVTTGYRVTIADEDGAHFNTMLTLMSTTTGFVFKEVMGQANTYELFLEKGVAIDRNKIVEYQFSDGVNTVTENVTVQIEADGEAKIPNRQAETHEPINPDYNPDDDPIAGLTPIPDTDPYA